MGKIIFCSGVRAEQPYIFPSTGVKLYTIEELCYYLVQVLDTLEDTSVDTEVALFLRRLGMEDRAVLLEHLISVKAGLRDRLAAIFCSADYYDEQEIKGIFSELEEMSEMSVIGRKKRRADRYMREGFSSEAMQEYRNILNSKDSALLSDTEYGDILHNTAVLQIRAGVFGAAAELFYEAYKRNNRKESLKQYLYALNIGHREGFYNDEMFRLVDNMSIPDEMQHELEILRQNLEQSGEMAEMSRLKLLWQQERYSEFDRLAGEIIAGLKRKYRDDNK